MKLTSVARGIHATLTQKSAQRSVKHYDFVQGEFDEMFLERHRSVFRGSMLIAEELLMNSDWTSARKPRKSF